MDASPATFRAALGLSALTRRQPRDQAAFRRLVAGDGPLGMLTRLCFVLAPGEQRALGASDFVERLAPQLAQELRRATRIEREVMRGRTRGRVDWPATWKQRNASDMDPTVFVCLPGWRQYDLPENQLFKASLLLIQRAISDVPASLKAWRAWGLAMPPAPGEQVPAHIGPRLELLAFRVRQVLGMMTLRNVTELSRIDSQHMAAARASKNERYAGVADFYEAFEQVAIAPVWERWRRVIDAALPLLPPEADAAGRLAVE